MGKLKWARCCAKKCLKPSRVLGRHDANRIQANIGPKKVFLDRNTKKEVFHLAPASGVMHLECFQAAEQKAVKA